MEFFTALLSTAAAKAVAGLTIAATAAGGAHAADVVDLPLLPDVSQEETVETEAVDHQDVVTEAKARRGEEQDDAEGEEETLEEGADLETGESEGDPQTGQGLGVDGQDVAQKARDGEVTGEEVRTEAIAGTPAEQHAPADPGPETGEERRADAPVPAEADRGGAADEAGAAQDDAGEPAEQSADAAAERGGNADRG